MKNGAFLFVVLELSAYFRKATADGETVWLKDVTTRFHIHKRTVSDADLPDQLSFYLKRKSHTLTLNLKRNHYIDPNADIYFVRKSNDGESVLEKTQNLEKEDVAYYQDRENGAYMTVRCVKRSNGQCNFVINGNIRIGHRNYNLRPSKADVKSRNFLEITGLLGKRYILQDQANIQLKMSMGYEEELNVNERNVEEKFTELPLHIPHGKAKQKQFLLPDSNLLNLNIGGLLRKGTTGENSYRGNDDRLNIRSPNIYHVEAAILIDSSVWDLFLAMSETKDYQDLITKAKRNVRKYFSHIINGVDLLYKGIQDTSISINVYVRTFILFQFEVNFPHNFSVVTTENGIKMIDGNMYMLDLVEWDKKIGSKIISEPYDQTILFTKHVMYEDTFDNTGDIGISKIGQICTIGDRVQIVHLHDYFITMSTTAHELGHSLGAEHDGEREAAACKAKDRFIMSPLVPNFKPSMNYSRNPWIFSNCSVESFKRTLANKTCLFTKGFYSEHEINEWNRLMMKLPGERYSDDKQCHLINGPGSTYCGKIPSMKCRFMYCTDPKTHKCKNEYWSAATGTECGPGLWCIEGLCVPKDAK